MAGGFDQRQAGPGGATSGAEAAAVPGKGTQLERVQVVAEHGLRVRSSPDQNRHDNVLGRLAGHTEIETQGHEGDWLKIAYRGTPAFIHSGFTKPAHAAAAADLHLGSSHAKPVGPPTESPPHPDPHPVQHDEKPGPSAKAPPPAHDEVKAPPKAPDVPPPPVTAPQTPGTKHQGFFQKIYTAKVGKGAQQVAVFVSPNLTEHPKVAVSFHGHDADLKISDQKPQKGEDTWLSGIDVAAETTRQATNTITMCPQGLIGGGGEGHWGHNEGGYNAALGGGIEAFIQALLPQVAVDCGFPKLSPSATALVGHSAGGYQGVADSLHTDADMDAVTDIALFDTDYADTHFVASRKWLVKKPKDAQAHVAKTLRISERKVSYDGAVAGPQRKVAPFEGALRVLGESTVKPIAEKAGFTIKHFEPGEAHGSQKVLQHYQVMQNDVVHADVWFFQTSITDHQKMRDDLLDDSILSVGGGEKSSDAYGTASVAGHGAKSIDGLKPTTPQAAPPAQQQQGGQPAKGHAATHAADAKPVTEADLHQVIAKGPGVTAPDGSAGPAHPVHSVTPADHGGAVTEQHGVAGPKIGAALATPTPDEPQVKTAQGSGNWLKDPSDVTSILDAKTKAAYDEAMAALKAGTLIFPQPKEPEGKSSAPFRKFVAAFYKHFGIVERRINLDIKGKGGDALGMKPYIESTLGDIPANLIAGNAHQMNKEMLAVFLKMVAAAEADGVPLRVLSAYRPPHAGNSTKNAYAFAGNGSSHCYGLAVDLQLSVDAAHNSSGKKFKVSETTTGDSANLMKYYGSPVMKWMVQNMQKFDFHPYEMEPWHFEYNPTGMAQKFVDGAKAWKAQKAS
ncbi:MAG TPA: D-alanyl-D-alanine carboxypeptidase family protein [Kofleriaceae bacterium]|jgi:D-alanyl-D-alanine dipeptidase